MNRNLLKEMKSISQKKNEWAIIMPTTYGKPLLKWTSGADTYHNLKFLNVKSIMKEPSKYIYIHNHPVLHWGNIKTRSSFSPIDMGNLGEFKFAEAYIVDNDLYHRITAKNWGDRPAKWYEKRYDEIKKEVMADLRKKVNEGKISMTEYCTTLDEKIVKKFCKELKWDYTTGVLTPSGKKNFDLYDFEVLPPHEIGIVAPWLTKTALKRYEKNWEEQKQKYPELKKYDEWWKMFHNELVLKFDE